MLHRCPIGSAAAPTRGAWTNSLIAALRAQASPTTPEIDGAARHPRDVESRSSDAEVRRLARSAGRDGGNRRCSLGHRGSWGRLLADPHVQAACVVSRNVAMSCSSVISWDLLRSPLQFALRADAESMRSSDAGAKAEALYTRRAAFSLIASAATRRRDLSSEQLGTYLDWISGASRDARPHVRKAVAWALRGRPAVSSPGPRSPRSPPHSSIRRIAPHGGSDGKHGRSS